MASKRLKPAPNQAAVGIPSRRIKRVRQVPISGPNERWILGVEEHQAERAGKHYDFRLIDPEELVAHSWVLPKAEWPRPGERKKLVRTFTHDVDYAMQQGTWEIAQGYGKGKVKKLTLEPVELVKSEPRIIKFQRYGPGQKVEEYAILRFLGKDDILYNMTKNKDVWIPEKPRYKDTTVDSLDPKDDKEIWQAKIDGAHMIVHLPKAGRQVRVYSVRKSKRTGEAIEHTPRLPDWHRLVTPSGYGGTVLRAEVWGVDKKGKPIPPQQLAGLLNKNVWDARAEMERRGIKLKLSPFDVVKWRGRPADKVDYRQKLDWLQQLATQLPKDVIELPDTAKSPEQKRRLLKSIERGAHRQTKEGVVVRRLEGDAPPIRAKLVQERDAKIVGVTKGRGGIAGKGIGGFVVKDELTGAESVVGTGLSRKLRYEAWKHPEKFKGLTVKVKVQQVFPSGKYRAPRFEGFHMDKNDPEKLREVIKFAAAQLGDSALSAEPDIIKEAAPISAGDVGALLTAGGLLANAIGISYLVTAMKYGRHLSRKALLSEKERIKKKYGMDIEFTFDPHLENNAFYADPASAKAYYHAGLIKAVGKDGSIVVGPTVLKEIVRHEIGHGMNDYQRNKTQEFASHLLRGLGMTATTTAMINTLIHGGMKPTTGTKVMAALTPLATLPVLVEEAKASLNAIEDLKRDKASKREIQRAKRNLKAAYTTYAGAAAAATGLGMMAASQPKKFEPAVDATLSILRMMGAKAAKAVKAFRK